MYSNDQKKIEKKLLFIIAKKLFQLQSKTNWNDHFIIQILIIRIE